MNYSQANDKLQGRNRDSRKIANNTYLLRHEDRITVKLHNTHILTYYPDNRVKINVNGWLTVTTKARINDYLRREGVDIFSDKGVWKVAIGHGSYDSKAIYRYHEGMSICLDTLTTDAEPWNDYLHRVDDKAQLKLKRQVSKYVDAYFKALDAGEVGPPNAGDCFFCQLRDANTGRTMGETFNNLNGKLADDHHILLHMEENYYVPSLLARAIEIFPVSQAAKWYLGSYWDTTIDQSTRMSARKAGGICRHQLVKALRRYILRQLGFGG